MLSVYKLSWQLTNVTVMPVTQLAFQNVLRILKAVSLPAMAILLVIKIVLEAGPVSLKRPLLPPLLPLQQPIHKKPLLLLLLPVLLPPALNLT